ncbi:hypothetical protein SAMN05444166_0735 [Singulisphaera sp. GP187]|uniref:hypothetical protein n=1 Tax=Singulisphaera sp. GP187 TaxID=1882752 RepID=UPI00092A7023|nr:hypothetical protein [Singulisphaera sp. GP187]SIN76837.1 hypothetical protein SAMN05444166_0735 [Singulisphaera sp. GP187]
MIAIRKAWWATLLLTVFIGCTQEEPTGDNPPPPPPSSAGPDATVPATTPSAEPAGEKPKDAMPEAELPKEVTPKDEAPKDAGDLKLDPPAVTPPAAKDEAADKKEEPKKDEAANKTTLTAEELTELAALSPADKELALKQLVCPVSGENLGSMGAPLKVSAEGKSFLICCGGCNKEVKANPKDVVAKLKN